MTASERPVSASAAGDDVEPPPPQRGLTREERGRDVSAAQAAAEQERSTSRRLLRSMSLPFVLSQADRYPVVIKQFLQFCLILIYPAWVVGVVVSAIIYYAVYSVLWVIFWPLRAWMKKNRPEEYAASQKK
jgi:YggT family protein